MLTLLEVEKSSLFLLSHHTSYPWVVMSCSLLTTPKTFIFQVTKVKQELSMQVAKPNGTSASASIESE